MREVAELLLLAVAHLQTIFVCAGGTYEGSALAGLQEFVAEE